MTKAKSFSALKTIIDTNSIKLTAMKWVERTTNTATAAA